MICAHCHKMLEPGARFCAHCGALSVESGSGSHAASVVTPSGTAMPPLSAPFSPAPSEQRQVWQPSGADRRDPYAPWQPSPAASDTPPTPQAPITKLSPPQATATPAQPEERPVWSTARLTGILLVLCVPILNFVIAFVWACSRQEDRRQLRNLGRAALLVITLVWTLLMAVIWWLLVWRFPAFRTVLDALR